MDYLLGQNTRDRLMRLLGNQGAVATLRAGGFRPGSAPWVLVRCTSATAIGGDVVRNQCYPAVLLDPACNELAPLKEPAECLLTVLGSSGNSAAPTAAKVYAAILTGDVEGDGKRRPRAFAAEDEAGSAAVYGQSVQTSVISITPDNTFVNAQCDITLPSAGTYEITVCTGVYGKVSSTGVLTSATVYGSLYNVTAGADLLTLPGGPVGNRFEMICIDSTNRDIFSQVSFTCRATVTVSTVVRLYALRRGGPTWSTCEFMSGNQTATWMGYKKLA